MEKTTIRLYQDGSRTILVLDGISDAVKTMLEALCTSSGEINTLKPLAPSEVQTPPLSSVVSPTVINCINNDNVPSSAKTLTSPIIHPTTIVQNMAAKSENIKESEEVKEAKEIEAAKEVEAAKEAKELKEVKENKESENNKEAKESSDANRQENQFFYFDVPMSDRINANNVLIPLHEHLLYNGAFYVISNTAKQALLDAGYHMITK